MEMTPARLTSLFGVEIPNRRDLIRDELTLSKYFTIRPLPLLLGLNPSCLAGNLVVSKDITFCDSQFISCSS